MVSCLCFGHLCLGQRGFTQLAVKASFSHPRVVLRTLTGELHVGEMTAHIGESLALTHASQRAPHSTCYTFTWRALCHSWITSSARLDGAVMSMVGHLAPILGRPIYVPFCDEDPFIDDPHQAFRLPKGSARVKVEKLANFHQARYAA